MLALLAVAVLVIRRFEGWSRDCTAHLAAEIRRLANSQLTDVPPHLQDFFDRHDPVKLRQLSLPLTLIR
jgi:hypothetical protein